MGSGADSRPESGGGAGRVVVFAPSPLLTITVEDHDGDGEIHLHTGGQGVWQARMVRALGVEVTLCASFAGETGRVLWHLVRDEGLAVISVERHGASVPRTFTTGEAVSGASSSRPKAIRCRDTTSTGCTA